MKNSIFFYMIILCSMNTKGQSVQVPQIIPPSPQAQIFEKYFNNQNVEYNGLLDISIPLYEINIKGLSIPITLTYNAGGIKYGQYDGEVGAGWCISAGGFRVNRNINGRDDFYYNKYNKSRYLQYKDNGDGYSLDAYLSSMVIWKDEYDQTKKIRPNEVDIDGEYDIFSYMTPSVTGHFLITERDNSGKPSRTTKIEDNLEKINIVEWDNMHIIDDKGFNYYFGGKQDDGSSLYELITGESKYSPTCWPLRQILSPFDEMIKFKYVKYTHSSQTHRGRTYSIKEPFLGTVTGPLLPDNSQAMQSLNSSANSSESSFRYNDMLYVQKIETEDIVVEFIRYGYGQSSQISPPAELIKEIVVKDKHNNRIIRKFALNYKKISLLYLNGSGYLHHLLESVITYSGEQSVQRYAMEYYGPSSLGTDEYAKLFADQWGFYKENISTASEPFIHQEFKDDKYVSALYIANGQAYPTVSPVSYLINTIPALDRSSNIQNTIHFFSLKKITYPSGGYSEYEYEPHKFRSVNSSKIVIGGGQRVRKIKSVTTDSEPVVTIFKYGENENGIGIGNIDFNKHLFASETHFLDYRPWGLRTIRHYSNKPVSEIDNSMFQVSYPEVAASRIKEKDNKEYGKTVSKYNILQSYTAAEWWGFCDINPTVQNFNTNPLGIAVYRLGYKPLLANRCEYNDNIKISEQEYQYINTTSNDTNVYEGIKINRMIYFDSYYGIGQSPYDYIVSAYNTMDYVIIRGGHLLSKKTTKTYSLPDIEPVSVMEQYKYNTRNQLIEKCSFNVTVDAENYVEEYSYPLANSELEKRNMLSTITKIRTGMQTRTQSVTRYNYPTNSILPDYAEGLNLRKEIIYDQYDKRGNLLQYTRMDGAKVSYLWSYNYKYPVAEIIGATYAQVSTVLGINAASLAAIPIPDDNTMNKIKDLRTNLPNAFVTVYTYIPFVGIASVTDPLGITIHYDYDAIGRLKGTYYIENGTKKKVQDYMYNYKHK